MGEDGILRSTASLGRRSSPKAWSRHTELKTAGRTADDILTACSHSLITWHNADHQTTVTSRKLRKEVRARLSDSTLKMSATTTDNQVSTTLQRTIQASSHLQDYEVRLSGDNVSQAPPNTDNVPRASPSQSSNPPNWDNDHRGVPPYRPINRELDRSQRPLGGNPVGDAFVFTMFTGVVTLSVSLFKLREGGIHQLT